MVYACSLVALCSIYSYHLALNLAFLYTIYHPVLYNKWIGFP
jgi:hypothetical protein